MRLHTSAYAVKVCAFQSTHPTKDETGWKREDSLILKFQSTHPTKDETGATDACRKWEDFNPLIQRRMRLHPNTDFVVDMGFQSTHPTKDETIDLIDLPNRLDISIHSSNEG